MGIERGSSLVAEPEPEAKSPSESLAVLDTLKEQAQADSELMERYEGIINSIDNYATAKIRHVRFAENDVARHHLGERYEGRFSELNENRSKAHNRLIDALSTYAQRSTSLGHDTSWWDGPDGLTVERRNRTVRQRIDDWAMDVWLGWEEEREEKEKRDAA